MKVIVAGAGGKMGQEVCRALQETEDLTLVAGVDVEGSAGGNVPMFTDLVTALETSGGQVVVDFTTAAAARRHMEVCLRRKIPMIVGTTGLSTKELKDWEKKARQAKWKALVAPNFAIGAVLMIEQAKQVAPFFDKIEIVEYHNDKKLDAPSGTALRTKEILEELVKKEISTHSVRLPGMVAHQAVIFGLPGQTLTIRHDSTDRISFMPGVLLAIRRIWEIEGLVCGLEHILFSDI